MGKICGGVVMLLILLSGSMAFALGVGGNLCSTMEGPFKNKCTPSFDSVKNLCAVMCKDGKGGEVSNTIKISGDGKRYIITTESRPNKSCSIDSTRSFTSISGQLICREF